MGTSGGFIKSSMDDFGEEIAFRSNALQLQRKQDNLRWLSG